MSYTWFDGIVPLETYVFVPPQPTLEIPTSSPLLTPPTVFSAASSFISSGIRHKRSVTSLQKRIVAAKQKWRCGMCDKLLNAWYEVDHIQPLHQGGSNGMRNLQALCRDCHGLKSTQERLRLHQQKVYFKQRKKMVARHVPKPPKKWPHPGEPVPREDVP